MNLIKYFNNSEIDDIALILRCLLDRLPIVISGPNDEEIEEFINELTMLIPFRNTMIFYTDFIENEDFFGLTENEEIDIETERNLFIAFPFAVEKIKNSSFSFKSWIIGCNMNSESNMEVINKLYFNERQFLRVKLQDFSLKTQIEGKEFINFDLTFEKWLFQNALKNTEISIEKMKRVISKRIKSKKIGHDHLENLMNFSYEEQEIKMNIIKKEINNFYGACKRAFNILNRLKNLESFGYQTKISSKTLFSTIAYKQATIERFIDFIIAEWNVHYEPFLESKKVSNFTDTFESLWG
jgi:hypothetical protein